MQIGMRNRTVPQSGPVAVGMLGLTETWRFDTELLPVRDDAATYARYWMTFFVFSVLPAPDSPLEIQHRIHVIGYE